jgi:hypothetical protein
MENLIRVSLYENIDGSWSYGVNIGPGPGGTHKIGTGHDYDSAARLAKSGAKTAKRFLETGQIARAPRRKN